MTTIPSENRPSLLRRLAAVLYDGLLLIALWMAASALWIGFQGGEAATAGDGLFRLYLLAIAYAFFTGFWVRGGHTLGMQAWRLRLVDADGGRVTVRAATHRFVAAMLSWLPAGLGFLWALFDREQLTWHDRLSQTYLRVEPKRR
ncbi:RDD family protein [Spiribacter vilamensis]|uniref:Putative RDD family membrane protein YckC n=1 Tax=Spiribacter vilamensis TaxID=531306 RepID=A0A4Q8D0V6_9GAMM|nr:RDD family protein [Spiribacter vilamensis]RZU98969.1 putative RDD family membrane protein YckC [Spiribacter vilamensis]TVO62022.1 RDD family protein [Spiribacter vilamensis]